MSSVVVTGANGLVGRAVCQTLSEQGHEVTALVRRHDGEFTSARVWQHGKSDFDGLEAAWPEGFSPDCVVHLAARVHVMHDDAPDPDAAFYATNVQGTLRVARAARGHGTRRFVFVSSVKAVAEFDAGVPLTESIQASPSDPYGRSKRAAEEALWRLGDETGLEVVVLRPPLVYGPGVGANFLQMMNAVWRGIPLPLGRCNAQRSLVYSGNLAHAISQCVTDARAANACFHVSDGLDLSVSQLLEGLGRHLEKPARLIPFPASLLRFAGAITGRTAQIERLTTSLRVNSSLIGERLGWQPPFTVEEGLEATARWYRATH